MSMEATKDFYATSVASANLLLAQLFREIWSLNSLPQGIELGWAYNAGLYRPMMYKDVSYVQDWNLRYAYLGQKPIKFLILLIEA